MRRLTAFAALLAVATATAGCGSDDSDDSASAQPETASKPEPGLAGKWVTENRCEELVDALRAAGLDAYIGQMLSGQYRHGTPERIQADARPCRGARSFEHSHGFDGNGGFASYDEAGQQVDQGTYATSGDELTVSRPPFDVTVRYRIRGDEAVFDLVVPPDCATKRCRDAVALGIGTFFPRTYERAD